MLDDPEATASELSEQELACIAQTADVSQLLQFFSDPNTATAEEQTNLIGCLNDETLARIFLSGFVPDPAPLSLESSTCIREAFKEIDPRAVMTAGIEGDSGAAMAGSMTPFTITLACLNQEVWETTAPRVGVNFDQREGALCLLEELGGPAEMAVAMKAATEGDITTLSAGAMECGLDMGAVPGQTPLEPTETPMPTATLLPTPTPQPTATPSPTSTPMPTPEPTQPPVQPSALWRGITVVPENRCSKYDANDYHYSPSVETRIVDAQGGIYGPYTGTWFESIKETDIEHIVARSEAHDSGLCAADPDTKDEFASDLLNLTLSSPSVNRHQKSDKDAAEWLPDLNQCWYVDRIVRVRLEYGLTIDRMEADAIDAVLAGCESMDMILLEPTNTSTATDTSTPTPAPAANALAMYDDNRNGRISCAEARAHGIAPVRRGHPAYEFMNDRDRDGVVCE